MPVAEGNFKSGVACRARRAWRAVAARQGCVSVSMRNLKIILAYDGAEFSGWQVQPDRPTIQGCLAEAVQRVTGEAVLPQGSGRTDAGVHALAQIASCTIGSAIPLPNLVIALNDLLPPSIRILQVREVPPDFHARTSARAKTYRYRIYRAPICPPFLARYVYHHPWPLDEEAMAESAALLLGEHDFSSFAAVDPERRARIRHRDTEPQGETQTAGEHEEELAGANNVRTIFCSQLVREADELIYTVRGSGFLHHMVRNIVGTLLLVGKGTLRPADLPGILRARHRSANPGATAPARGLCLVSVEYGQPLPGEHVSG